MANNFYSATVLIGGGTGALDAINGTLLADGDAAMVQTDGTVYFYHLDAASGAAESSPDIITPDSNAGTKRWIKQAVSGGAVVNPYLKYYHKTASGVSAGTFTSGSWQTRPLTDEVQDTHNLGSLASNVITLAAGTYKVWASCQGYRVDVHKSRLYNVTDAAVEIYGSTQFGQDVATAGEVQSDSVIIGVIVLAAQKDLRLEHRCSTTKTSSGMGVGGGFDDNIFAQIEFEQIDS